MAVASQRTPESVQQIQENWKKRIYQSRDAQQQFHGTWATNLAFAAGQHWLAWDKTMKQLRSLKDVDPKYRSRELFIADRITEFRQAQLGELTAEDERPELLVAQSGDDAEKAADMLNRLVAYAWDNEWEADSALLRARRLCLDLGVSAIRCKRDATSGEVAGHVGPEGQPYAPETLDHVREHGMMPDGSLPQFQPVYEGKTCWEVYSAFQILTPPGVTHEDDFAWEGLVCPVLLDEVEDVYGIRVMEDTDIASGIGIPSGVVSQSGQPGTNRLRDHAWLYTCYDRPSTRNPQGRTVILGGSDFKILDIQNGLPYKLAEKPHSGIVYFHWWRLSDRFHSRSFIEGLKDPQRVINRRKTQNVEIIDRGMPKLISRKGDWPDDTTGAPMEIVELSANAQAPQTMEGVPPGQWMYQDVAAQDDDLAHASTLSALRLGENPESVQTYGQLALLNDNEHGKRATVQVEHRRNVATLIDLGLADVKQYWPEEKQALIVGDDDRIEQVTFQKSLIPAQYRVKVPKGAPLPRSQGAEIKKVDAILQAAIGTGAVAANPVAWTNWYKDSLDAGSPQDLPAESPSSQKQLAKLENMLMRQGEEVEPAYYDQLEEHLPEHRTEEDQARAQGDFELAARIERHLLRSLEVIQEHMAAQTTGPEQAAQSPLGTGGAGTPVSSSGAPQGSPPRQAQGPPQGSPSGGPPSASPQG